MNFRFDFHQQLDLSRFRKYAALYFHSEVDCEFEFYLLDFRLLVKVLNGSADRVIQFAIQEKKRKADLEWFDSILPGKDVRFNELTLFKENWILNGRPLYELQLILKDVENPIEYTIETIKTLHSINRLKAWI